jgi:hypothetical protein
VLSKFRARLVAHGLEERVLTALLAALQAKGLVKRVASSAPTPPT